MTVLDSSVVLDFLLRQGAADEVEAIIADEIEVAAPDLLVFEVLAALRRHMLRGILAEERATAAVTDLRAVALDLFPTLPLRRRAWELRANLTAADALFVALAEHLAEPLATKDRALGRAARQHAGVEVMDL